MHKDFWKVTVLVVLVVVFTGIVAWILPGCDKGAFKLKKLKWFEWLGGERDTTLIAVDSTALAEAARLPNEIEPLKAVLDKLNGMQSGQGYLRIAYFGDSIIEGDLITQQLRHNLQSRFGGAGIGFVPITSMVAGFRKTIGHEFAKNWESLSFMTPYQAAVPLGISGYTFIPRNYYTAMKAQESSLISSDDTLSAAAPPDTLAKLQRFYTNTPPWVAYQTVKSLGGANSFDRIRLFYSHSLPESRVKVSIDKAAGQDFTLQAGDGVQMLDLSQSLPVHNLRLEFAATNPLQVYGLDFDRPAGVYVDNFPIRGYSGMYFQRITSPVLQGFQQYLHYDLIILHYGENISNPKVRDYGFYREAMKKTLAHLNSALPGVPILLVSAHDRSIKSGSSYVTSPDIPFLIKAQKQVASDNGCGFWNLFEAMGGSGSMKSYVQKRMASTDYTHFNKKGADFVADMLTEWLLNRGK